MVLSLFYASSLFLQLPKVLSICGRGNISLVPSLTLKDLLHVPKLSNSLVFVHKLFCNTLSLVVFFKILLWGGRLELLRNMEGYILSKAWEPRVVSIKKLLPLSFNHALLMSPFEFDFFIVVLDIWCFIFLSPCFLLYFRKSLLGHSSVMYLNLQSTIMSPILLVIQKVLILFI